MFNKRAKAILKHILWPTRGVQVSISPQTIDALSARLETLIVASRLVVISSHVILKASS